MKHILVGPSCSGKDYLSEILKEKGLNMGVKTTTRPMRVNEIDGVTYNYINDDMFNHLDAQDSFVFKQSFLVKDNTWYYGLTKEEFDKKDIFILTPYELSLIDDLTLKNFLIMYLDTPRDIREQRLLSRNDKNDDIYRRLESDDKDFENFTRFDIKITN